MSNVEPATPIAASGSMRNAAVNDTEGATFSAIGACNVPLLKNAESLRRADK